MHAVDRGTDTFAEMTARIEAIRRRTGSALLARPQDYKVGCIMISQPVFFARDDWVADHADWHPRIQGGKTIEIAPFTARGNVHLWRPSASLRGGVACRPPRSSSTGRRRADEVADDGTFPAARRAGGRDRGRRRVTVRCEM